jgi:undecaprenyl-diphosphatase
MLLYVLILAVLQGITEFLPVSSSGHLALGSIIFKNLDQPGIIFEILLHIATSIAVIIYLRREIWAIIKGLFSLHRGNRNDDPSEAGNYRRLLLMIIVASIPTAVIGLLLKNIAEEAFKTGWMVAAGFLVTGLVLSTSRFFKLDRKSLFDIGYAEALFIGTIQGIAVFPGVSRSGMTITAGLASGCKPEPAAKFSFLLSLPAILGALVLDFKEMGTLQSDYLLIYLAGMLVAAVIAFISIKFLIALTKKWKLHYFAPYCIIIGILLFILSK